MRKVVINTLICLVCTAIIFYLHFAVYDGMLLQEPFFIGSICAVCIVFALRSNIDDQTYTTQWNYPTAFLRIRLYQLLWCTIAVSIPVILITEPYHFEYWFALTCIVVIALISKSLSENRSCRTCYGYGDHAGYDGGLSAGCSSNQRIQCGKDGQTSRLHRSIPLQNGV